MHLLLAQPGEADTSEPVDLEQTPADIVVLSAADTDLAALSEARATLETPPTLRLASLLHLGHPLSVDLYLDKTATKSRLVIARVLGGEAYWPYGIEQFAARLAAAKVPFIALPGDDKPDAGLRRISAVDDAAYDALHAYFVEGGPENIANLLRLGQSLIDGGTAPPPVRPLLRAGVYWPGTGLADLDAVREGWHDPEAPVVPIVFYRSLLQGAGLNPVNRLVRGLLRQGLNPLPIFVASLKDSVSAATVRTLFDAAPPTVILNATAFAVSTPQSGFAGTVLDGPGVPVLQTVFSGGTEAAWAEGLNGLSARDIAMNVALPEVDGRILGRAVSFKGEAFFDDATQCPIAAYRAVGDRIDFTARLAAGWAKLAAAPVPDRKVAIVLANYPNRDGRIANGVGLDTPASVAAMLATLNSEGYAIEAPPADGVALMDALLGGPTNWLADRVTRTGGVRLTMEAYRAWYGALPYDARAAIEDRWGPPEQDPFVGPDGFALSVQRYGNAVVAVQPARGYNIDPTETYHAPDLVPPHNYLAFYLWLRSVFGTHAIVHFGKHGNLEWLPGKALALSETCWPEIALGAVPHLYPFIVNDPGEGTQAKRRTSAVVIDHLTPPLTRAETYGPLRDLEALVDEYYDASSLDPRRRDHLRTQIRELMASDRLDMDAGVTADMDEETALTRLDAYLCDLKEAQIRDGLHVFGAAPVGRLRTDTLVALARVPRGRGPDGESLIRALAHDFGLGEEFDPLDCDMAAPWTGPRPAALTGDDPWRTAGDTIERLETMACRTVEGAAPPGPASAAVLDWMTRSLAPDLDASGQAETTGLLTGLSGLFVAPGPSGAPTRGRPDVLPTGRNFYSVDTRAVPTPAAWTLGWKSASLLIERHLQDHGDWPRTLLLTAWGTANMRTGGDDIAQALALMGVRPRWDDSSRRVIGFEVIPVASLGRPRVDVTLRVSGFFRDAFPAQIDLVDAAARAVMALAGESADDNPARAAWIAEGGTETAAHRVFGAKPGAYGAGLQAMIDERLWDNRADLADSYVTWGGYAYGAKASGLPAHEALGTRLARTEIVAQNQDNREHDLLDSDDYYQFEGGAAAAVEHLSGRSPTVYHNDHSRPDRPVIRTLDEEIGRVVRSRVVNPKWIAGVMRHGYKGAFEIAATVDYLFAFAATTNAVRSHHFDLVHAALIDDDAVRDFLAEENPAAHDDILDRLSEAIDRGLWQPRANDVPERLARLRKAPRS